MPGRRGTIETLPKTDFYIGCVASPFKRYERELVPQYFKLLRKIEAGARWVIPQLGYDMRKFHEISLFMDWARVSARVIGNVYVLNRTTARLFNQGKIPGCVVSDPLYELSEKYAGGADKGRAFFHELAEQQQSISIEHSLDKLPHRAGAGLLASFGRQVNVFPAVNAMREPAVSFEPLHRC